TGAIEFSEHTAADVMVPLDRVVSVPAGITVEDFEKAVVETGFSRLPVREGDRLVGYLHIKDALYARPGEREEPIHAWRVRELPPVPVDAEIEEVLAKMRGTGAHMASAQRGGQPVGVVFLEDIIEELVGEVQDASAGP